MDEGKNPEEGSSTSIDGYLVAEVLRAIKSPLTQHMFDIIECHINGEKAFSIVLITKTESVVALKPLFVTITPGMKFTDVNGDPGMTEREFELMIATPEGKH